MAGGRVKFNLSHVLIRMNKASEVPAAAIAMQIQARTKANIQGNGQIDTGFMLNSTYTITKAGNTYGQAGQSGYYTNKFGKSAKRELAPMTALPGGALAAAAVGANYAIYQEEKKPFLYPACVDAAADAGLKATAQKVFQDNLRD